MISVILSPIAYPCNLAKGIGSVNDKGAPWSAFVCFIFSGLLGFSDLDTVDHCFLAASKIIDFLLLDRARDLNSLAIDRSGHITQLLVHEELDQLFIFSNNCRKMNMMTGEKLDVHDPGHDLDTLTQITNVAVGFMAGMKLIHLVALVGHPTAVGKADNHS